MMSQYRLQEQSEVDDLLRAALDELGRDDTPFRYGVADDPSSQQQILYFDLPRISPLQFNLAVGGGDRRQLVDQIKAMIIERLEVDQ